MRIIVSQKGNLDDISLKIIDEDFENIGKEESNLRVAILQRLCLEIL